MMNVLKKQAGLSFVEVMVTVLLFCLIAGGLYSVVLIGNSSWKNFQSVVMLQQEVRRAMGMLVRDLRPAENLTFHQGERQLLINFRHPVYGDMGYRWSAPEARVGSLVRYTAQEERPIAQSISDLNILVVKDTVKITVSGQTISRDGKPIDLTLRQQLMLRR